MRFEPSGPEQRVLWLAVIVLEHAIKSDPRAGDPMIVDMVRRTFAGASPAVYAEHIDALEALRSELESTPIEWFEKATP